MWAVARVVAGVGLGVESGGEMSGRAVERFEPSPALLVIQPWVGLDRPAVVAEVELDGGAVLAPEVVVGKGQERCALEPGLDGGEQRRLALGPFDQATVLGRKRVVYTPPPIRGRPSGSTPRRFSMMRN